MKENVFSNLNAFVGGKGRDNMVVLCVLEELGNSSGALGFSPDDWFDICLGQPKESVSHWCPVVRGFWKLSDP